MTGHVLILHPNGGAQRDALTLVATVAAMGAGTLRFEYRLAGNLANVAIPGRAPARRAERLWERTCFEAFVAPTAAAGYCELNFSPSTEWAAYEFDGYRLGMRPLEPGAPPTVAVVEAGNELRVTASMELPALARAPWPWRVGLTAVVEDRAGERSYFALAHPRAKPDFHDAAGFAISLDGSAR